MDFPEATLCLQQHRECLSSTTLLIEYYKFVLHFIEILDRQNIVCEQKRVISDMLVGKIIDDIVITTLVVDLDVR
jgi:hypothetical protein